jgi:hypothetical protein
VKSIISNDAVVASKTIFDYLGQPEDISSRVKRMPRDAAILYPKTKDGRIECQGVVRLSGGGYYWALLWISSLEPVTGGIRFIPWKRPHPVTGQVPSPNSRPVSVKLVLAEGGTHLEGFTERAKIEVRPRLAKGKPVFELILSPAKGKEVRR